VVVAPAPAPTPRIPPLGRGASLAKAMLETKPADPMLRLHLRIAYMRQRAIDFGIYAPTEA
jgi:hypothetical protein